MEYMMNKLTINSTAEFLFFTPVNYGEFATITSQTNNKLVRKNAK